MVLLQDVLELVFADGPGGLGPAGAPTVGADLEAGDWLHCAVGPGGGCAW
jgi:hypothetical protein